MKKYALIAAAIALVAASAVTAPAADEAMTKLAPAAPKVPAAGAVKAPAPGMPPARPAVKANVSMIYGTVTNIDAKDPSKVKLEITTEADKKTHAVEVLPTTTVTKLTDIADVKKGDNVRVMARKVDDKDVAMGIMFGKIRKPAAKRPPAAGPQLPAAPAVKAQPKK